MLNSNFDEFIKHQARAVNRCFFNGDFVVPVVSFNTNDMEIINAVIEQLQEDNVDFFHRDYEDPNDLRQYADLTLISSVDIDPSTEIWYTRDYTGEVVDSFMVFDEFQI